MLGDQFSTLGRFDEAENSLTLAVTMLEELATRFPDHEDYQRNLMDSHSSLGLLTLERKRYADAELHLRQALEIQPQLATDSPKRFRDRFVLAKVLHNLGLLLSNTGREEEAEQTYLEAIRVWEQLIGESPKRPHYRTQLGSTLSNLAGILRKSGRLEDAERVCRRAVAIHEGLLEEFPDHPDYQSRLGGALHGYARLLSARGHFDAAVAAYERAIEHQQEALETNVHHPKYRTFLRNHYHSLGGALRSRGRTDEAIAAYERAIEVDPEYAEGYCDLGLLLTRSGSGRHDEAIKHLAKGHTLGTARSEWKYPSARWFHEAVHRYAAFLARDGGRTGVRKALEAGVRALPTDPGMLNSLAWYLVDPGGTSEQWDFAAAVPIAARAVEYSERGNPIMLDTLAVALFRNGSVEEAISIQEELLRLMDGRDAGSFKLADAQAKLAHFKATRDGQR